LNIVTACLGCNNRRATARRLKARMPLLTSQSALRVKLERVVLCHYAEARTDGASTLLWMSTMIVT